jgi:RHS repeat-associated protein
VIIHTADGTSRYYRFIKPQTSPTRTKYPPQNFELYAEKLPNGHWMLYDYTPYHSKKLKTTFRCLSRIWTTNPSQTTTFSSVNISWPGPLEESQDQHFQTSDGRYFNYLFNKHQKEYANGPLTYFRIRSVFSYNYPSTSFDHLNLQEPNHYFLKTISLPDSRILSLTYENDRVKTLSAPVGKDATLIQTHRFVYDPANGITHVFDINGNKTTYRYSANEHIESIEQYTGSEQLHHLETFSWDGPNLLSRTFCDQNRKPLFSRTFTYDIFGNVKEEKLIGNLSGQAENETAVKKFSYNADKHLSRLEDPNGSVTLFHYLPGTNLVVSKLICDGEKIKLRHFYKYNNDNLLEKEISDDGTSPDKDDLTGAKTRRIKEITLKPDAPYLGMPQTIQEKYWDGAKEVLLRKVILTYTTGGKIAQQDVYDATGSFQYSLKTKYNDYGLPIEETNALGQTAFSDYDANGNKISYTDFGSKLTTRMTYDFSNRLVKTEEVENNIVQRTTTHKYDTKHNRTSTTNFQNQETRFVPDSFGHILETHLPPITHADGKLVQPISRASYDSVGNPISTTTPKGDTTSTVYNAYGKPTIIIYPDNSKETFVYNLDGTLKTHINQEGTETSYTYDFLGRLKSVATPLSVETYEYDAFNLISKTDGEGNITHYEYDGAGRKIAEQIGKERTEYAYDALGRMHRLQKDDIVVFTEYDLLDRPIEEREETPSGKLLKKTKTKYDAAGNKHIAIRFIDGKEAHDIFLYDAYNRLTSHTNALGHTTAIEYNDFFINVQGQKVVQKTTTDPSGLQIVETFDTHGQIASTEKRSSSHESLYLETFTYDLNGNLQLQNIAASNKTVSHFWDYDTLDRLATQIEGYRSEYARTTSYTYTSLNLVHQITKSDGVVLTHTYDILGYPDSLTSSDQTIHYTYTYNRIGQEIAAQDHVLNQTAAKKYDPQGRLLEDTLAHGYTISSSYDLAGRRRILTLPDTSTIAYTYEGSLLKTIHRNGYTHEYTTYDLDGNLLEEKLIHNTGSVSYSVDPLGRRTTASSPYFHQAALEFDPVGNLKKMERNQTVSEYSYDSLHQLQTEPSHAYLHDALHNRLAKDNTPQNFDDLNQLDSTEYDPNGNPTEDQGWTYVYDALDRLTSIETPTQKIVFTYDSDHRRLSKTVFAREYGSWKQASHLLFLYDGPREIGAIEKGEISELRILSNTPSEISSAIALELKGKTYVPIHDLQGNLSVLVDPYTRQIVESYSYTAFGEGENTSHVNNPWRFAAKRSDDETGLMFFGLRYYNHSLGRWLTPDPAGFTDSMNRYAFALNNPFMFSDLFGLLAEFNTDNIGASQNPFSYPQSLSSLEYSAIKPASQEFASSSRVANSFVPLSYPEASNLNFFTYANRGIENNVSDMGHTSWQGAAQQQAQSFLLNGPISDNLLPKSNSSVGMNVYKGIYAALDLIYGIESFAPSAASNLKMSIAGIPMPGIGKVGSLAVDRVKNIVNPIFRTLTAYFEKQTLTKIGTHQQIPIIAGKISGYTNHGLNQVIGRDGGRGVNAKAILDAIRNPIKCIEKQNEIKFIGKDATVILNKDGKIITAFGKPRGPAA